MTVYRILFEGPAPLAVRVATELADAEGVELISSDPPSTVGVDKVKLSVSVEAGPESVAEALAGIRDGLPSGASIAVADD